LVFFVVVVWGGGGSLVGMCYLGEG